MQIHEGAQARTIVQQILDQHLEREENGLGALTRSEDEYLGAFENGGVDSFLEMIAEDEKEQESALLTAKYRAKKDPRIID